MPTRLIATLTLIFTMTLAACSPSPRPTPILPRDVPSPTFVPMLPSATAPTIEIVSPTAIPIMSTASPGPTLNPESADEPTSEPAPPVIPSNNVSIVPKIDSLTVTPNEGVKAGDIVRASWEADGVKAQLCITAYDYYGGECQTVPTSGTQDLMIRNWEGIVIVTLKVWGQNPASEAETGYRLSLGCTHAWVWDSMDNHKRCPGPSTLITGAAQPFEHGWMVWTGNHYYILFDRPSDWNIPYTYDIEEVPDPLEITRDTSAQYTAPDGLYAPLSGFGLVWRGDVSLSPGYITDLGWALTPETYWEAYTQCWSLKGYTGAAGGISECYFVHPSRGLIAIVRDGIQFYWEFVS